MRRPPFPSIFSKALLAISLLATTGTPAAGAARASIEEQTHSYSSVPATDLSPVLAADGTFLGAPAMSGTIDAGKWRLVSDLAAGQPPRFEPASEAGAPEPPAWSALGSTGATDGALTNFVRALAVSGGDLYVGGDFTNAAGIAAADYVARWDGTTWSALGSNGLGDGALGSRVDALAASGSNVYVGGLFTNAAGVATVDYVARWDGGAWSALGSNIVGTDGALIGSVRALSLSGNDVYVGGFFTNAAAIQAADFVARWDGSNWFALGSGLGGNGAITGPVEALAVSGADLYAGGSFLDAAGVFAADRVARWDGNSWSALGSNGSGNGAINNLVTALAVSGSNVYVGGSFTDAGGDPAADYVARWSGSEWAALGSNGAGNGAINNPVLALAVSGTDLYVGGNFTDVAGNSAADYVALWDGTTWSALDSVGLGNGSITFTVQALAASGTDVYVGGGFHNAAGSARADYIARWNGTGWSPLGANSAADGALSNGVAALAVSGSDLYVGGYFTDAAGILEADYVARWNGTAWSALGSNGAGDGALDNYVLALTVDGSNLYVGGAFAPLTGPLAGNDGVARWNGSSWSGLQQCFGMTCETIRGVARALAVLHGELFVGGDFDRVGGAVPAHFIARVSGDQWSAVGSFTALNGPVFALAVVGNNLYVGGQFTNAAGIATADYVARWDGTTWSSVGSDGSGDGALNGHVRALAVSGSQLYVGGSFTNAAGIATADYAARWNGTAWSALGSNGAGNGALDEAVYAVAVSGSDLYVGGSLTNAAGNAEADHVAHWNGSAWSALGSDGAGNGAINGDVYALAVADSDLYVGGEFDNAASLPEADYVAHYGPLVATPPGLPPCASPPFVDVPIGHPFCREIKWMADEGISTGFPADNTYRPDIAVSRQAMSAFMARLALGSAAAAALPPCASPPFVDVPIEHPFCKEIRWMADEGISTGFPADNTYRPDIAVSRQAMSAFMARLALGSATAAALPPCASPPFVDVPIEHPFCKEIRWMADEGISTGFPADNTYRPDIAVSRQAMSAFMYRVSGLLVDPGEPDTTPDTSITSGPSGITLDLSPNFYFTSSEPGSTFECALDEFALPHSAVAAGTSEDVDEGTFQACTSGAYFNGDRQLLQHSHQYTFKVRAIDTAGNVDPTPATRTFIMEPINLAGGPYAQTAAELYFPTSIDLDIPAPPALPTGTLRLQTSGLNVVYAGANQNRFDVTATINAQSLTGFVVNIPLIGDCTATLDSSQGSHPSWKVTTQLQFNYFMNGDVRIEPQSPSLSDFDLEDVALSGGLACSLVGGVRDLMHDVVIQVIHKHWETVGSPLCEKQSPTLVGPCPAW